MEGWVRLFGKPGTRKERMREPPRSARRGFVSIDIQRVPDRFRFGANANPNANRTSDTTITVMFPLVT